MLPASGSDVRPRWFYVLPWVPAIDLLCLTLSLHVFAAGARFGGCSVLDFMRAFAGTGPFVRMIVVIARDLIVFGIIAAVFLLASTSFFLINDGDKTAFALDQQAIGPAWRECSHSFSLRRRGSLCDLCL